MIPANYCQAGRVINIKASGIFSTTLAPTLAIAVYYGTDATVKTNDTLIGVTSTLLATTSGSTNLGWRLDFDIICQTTTGMNGQGMFNFALTTTTSTNVMMYAYNNSAVVSTSDKSLYLFPAWGTSSASNWITASQIVVTGM